MLTPEEKKALADIIGVVNEILQTDAGEGEMTSPGEMGIEQKQLKPEDEDQMAEKEQETDEVGNEPADSRVGGIEDDEVEGNKAAKALLAALTSLSVGKQKKSEPIVKSKDEQLTTVLKGIADELKFQRETMDEILSGFGVDAVIEKEMKRTPEKLPYAQSSGVTKGSTLESIQKALEVLAGTNSVEKEHDPELVRKEIGGLLQSFGNNPLWNPEGVKR